MKLRSGRLTSGKSESVICDTEKKSVKVVKVKCKRKNSCDGTNFIASETAHTLNENGGEGCLRPMTDTANSVVSKTAVTRFTSQGFALPNALINQSSVSSDSAIINDPTNFHQTSLNMRSVYSERSSDINTADVRSSLSLCSAKTFPSNGSNVGNSLQVYSPHIIGGTNTRNKKAKCKMNICSVIDRTSNKISKSVEVLHEINNSVLKISSVKQGHQDILVGTASQKMHDSPAVPKCNNQGSAQEDDSCSVISLGSDSEVIILDSDPEPRLDCSSTSDVVIIDTVSSAKRFPNSDVVTVSPGKCARKSNKFQAREYATHKRNGRYARNMKKKIKQKLKAVLKRDVSILGNMLETVQHKENGLSSVRHLNMWPGIVPFATAASASSNFAPVSNPNVGRIQGHAVTGISSTMGYNQMCVTSASSTVVHGSGFQHWNHNAVSGGLQPIHNQVHPASAPYASRYGTNLYNPNPNTVKNGLRPIIIDGSNVAMGHSSGRFFSCKGLKICIDYFLKRGHKVVAFVPQFRKSSCYSPDAKILDDLEKQGLVSFTPSRRIGNRLVVPYDDRYTVQYAAECGGVIVSTDNYRDLLKENSAWRETIENRLLMFTWVGDVLMFPQDPLGRYGPNLDRFLRFP